MTDQVQVYRPQSWQPVVIRMDTTTHPSSIPLCKMSMPLTDPVSEYLQYLLIELQVRSDVNFTTGDSFMIGDFRWFIHYRWFPVILSPICSWFLMTVITGDQWWFTITTRITTRSPPDHRFLDKWLCLRLLDHVQSSDVTDTEC